MDTSGSDRVMGIDAEAKTVMQNLKGDLGEISEYVVQRCGDFTLDSERAAFIAAFLRASDPAGLFKATTAARDALANVVGIDAAEGEKVRAARDGLLVALIPHSDGAV